MNGNREDREGKKEEKEKLHSLKGDEDTCMATELPKKKKKKPQKKLENIDREGIAYHRDVWEGCL